MTTRLCQCLNAGILVIGFKASSPIMDQRHLANDDWQSQYITLKEKLIDFQSSKSVRITVMRMFKQPQSKTAQGASPQSRQAAANA